MDRYRFFSLTWKDHSHGPNPADWFSLMAKFTRPRRKEVENPSNFSEILWSSPGRDSIIQISPPDPNERDDLLMNEQRLPYIGLTKFSDIPDGTWSEWLESRIEAIVRDSKSPDDDLWIRLWGDIKLSHLPGDPVADEWIGRQEFRYIDPFKEEWKSRFEPIIEFAIAIDIPSSRIAYLSIWINSSVYTSMDLYPFFSDIDVNEPWLPDFVKRNVGIFCAWMSEVSRTITLTSVEWETTYRHEYGSELEPIFEELLGPPVSRA